MEKQIKIKIRYQNKGLRKTDGKPYTLTKFLTQNGDWLSTFQPIDLKEGEEVLVEVEPEALPGKYKLIRIIDANPKRAQQPGEPDRSQPTSDEPQAAADKYLTENITACRMAYNKQFGDLPLTAGAPIMAELLHLRHSFIMSERIQKNKLKNMGMI